MHISRQNVRYIVEQLLILRSTLSSARSTLGDQLDALEIGQFGDDDGRYWRKYAASNQKTSTYALLIKIWASLTPEEQRVLLLRYAPQVKLDKNGHAIRHIKLVRACDITERRRAGEPPVLETRAGEELVRFSTEYEGYAEVECAEMVSLSTEEIAKRAGLSVRQVRSRLQSAHEKLAGLNFKALTRL